MWSPLFLIPFLMTLHGLFKQSTIRTSSSRCSSSLIKMENSDSHLSLYHVDVCGSLWLHDDGCKNDICCQFDTILRGENMDNREHRVIDVESFILWRMEIGTAPPGEEVRRLFHTITKDREICTLSEFIEINHIINEHGLSF